MSITRVGATKQYSDNWENIFGNGSGRSTTKKNRVAVKSKPAKKAAKKKVSQQSPKKSPRRK